VRVTERKNPLDQGERRVGEKIVATILDYNGKEGMLIMTLEDRTLCKFEASSLRHILESQKSDH